MCEKNLMAIEQGCYALSMLFGAAIVELLSLKNRQVCALFDKSMKLGTKFACVIYK